MRRWTAVLGSLAALAAAAAPAGAAPLVRAKADVRIQGPQIPKSFLGFSQEYELALAEAGPVGGPVNPVLVQLYRNLAAHGAGTPVLRIGGGSQDSAWWNPSRAPRPPDISYDITEGYLQAISRFLTAADAKAIIGLNLAVNRPEVPVAVADAFQRVVDRRRILAFEVGNEPDFYPLRTQGFDENGKAFKARPKGYDHDDYLPELERHLDALREVAPRPPLGAPGYCCHPWLDGLPKLLRRNARDLDVVTLHRYPLRSCNLEPGSRRYPRASTLLRQDVALGNTLPFIPAVRAARKRGLGVRVTEANSVACGGAVRVSDRFAAALWAEDWLFHLAAIGVKGINFHSSAPLYQPFSARAENGRFRGIVKPLYFAMLVFSEAAANRPRLLPTSYFQSRVRRGNNVKVWAVVDRTEKVVRVVVIHKGGRSGGAVDVKVPFARRSGRLKRLRAAGLLASSGVTWGGQGFATPTFDGALVGEERVETVRRRRGARFRFRVPRGSATMLTVPVRRTRPDRVVR